MASAYRQKVTGSYSMQRTHGRNNEDIMFEDTSSLRTVKPKYRGIFTNNISNNSFNLLEGYEGYHNFRNNTRVQFNDLLQYLLKKREHDESPPQCNFAGVRETFSRLMSLALSDQDKIIVYCQKVANTIYILDEKCPVEPEQPSYSFPEEFNSLNISESYDPVVPVRILTHADSIQSFANPSRSERASRSSASSRQSNVSRSTNQSTPASTMSTVNRSVSTSSSTRSFNTNTPTSSRPSFSQDESRPSHVSYNFPTLSWNHFNYAKNKLKATLTDYFDVNRQGSMESICSQSFFNVYEKLIHSPDDHRNFRIMYTGEIDATKSNDQFYDPNARTPTGVLLRMRLSPHRKFSWHARQKKFSEWWANAYLSGVNHVVVAHHSPSFSVHCVECYDLEQLNHINGNLRRRDSSIGYLYKALSQINDLMRNAKEGEMYQMTYPNVGYGRSCLQVFEEDKKLLNSDIIYRLSS